MPALHGVRLSLDSASVNALAPWLDEDSPESSGPIVEVEILARPGVLRPAVLEVLFHEQAGWLGRTSSGLMVWNSTGAWFRIEGAPQRISGVLGEGASGASDLLLGALLLVLRSLGVYPIHAAAITFAGQALMLVGDSGAGKSTTATALVSAGCRYLGDDGVLIRQRAGDVELLPFWPSFRLTEQSLASFEGLKPHASKLASDEKWRLNMSAAFPERFVSSWLGRKALLFLGRSAGNESHFSAISQADALGLLIAQSNALGLSNHPDPRQHLDLLAQLVRVAHCARLELGGEWLADPAAAAARLLQSALLFSRPADRSEAS